MSFYKWSGSKLEINENGVITELAFPEKIHGAPVFNRNRSRVAVAAEGEIYVYDFENEVFEKLSYKSKYPLRDIRFDNSDNLYYAFGNDIRFIDTKSYEDILLYNAGRKQHNPQNLGVSPDGRYVSFCRYRSDNLYLYLFDTKEKELKDYKVCVYHYSWLDDDHIVWSKGGGLKVLDVTTGKSGLIVKDHKSLAKKISREDAELFDEFKGIESSSLFTNLNLIRVLNGNIYFSLDICWFGDGAAENKKRHCGLWSFKPEENKAMFHYKIPGDYIKAVAGHKLLMNSGNLAWMKNEWHIFDGEKERTVSGDWEQVIHCDCV